MIKFGKRIAFALAMAGASLSLPANAAPVPLDSVVAIANNGIVLQSELDTRIALIEEQLSSRGTRLPPSDVLRSQVLDQLVTESLQLQLGSNQGIRITEEQLNLALQRIASANNLTLEQFRAALVAEGENYPQAREKIRREMLLKQIQQRNVGRRIKVTDQEIDNYLASEKGRESAEASYHLRLILITTPPQSTPDVIKQKETEVQNIYQQLKDGAEFSNMAATYSKAPNALDGGELGWRKPSEMPEAIAEAMAKLSVSEISEPIRTSSGFIILQVQDKKGGTVKLVDQAKVSHILLKPSEIRTDAQAKRLIDRLHSRITEGGEDFAALAKEYSDDPASGSEGGDLGWTQAGQMVPEFENMSNLTPVGQVSMPFKTQFGWHILTVLERRKHDQGEKILANQARNSIRKRKFNEELINWLRELRAEAFIEIK